MSDRIGLRLPDLGELNLSSLLGEAPLRAGMQLLFKQRSLGSIGAAVAYNGAMGLVERMMRDGGIREMGGPNGPQRFEHWLRTVPQATLAIVGGRGEGKTTAAFDILDRFIAPTKRGLFTFGVPEEVLPAGVRAIPLLRLRQMGTLLKANPDLEGALIDRLFDMEHNPEGFAVLIDDASIYLNAHAHAKPEALALQTIVNVARHYRGIVLATFQNGRDVGRAIREVDALIASRPNVLTMGPQSLGLEGPTGHVSESDELRAWMEQAAIALDGLPREDRILTKFVACASPEVHWAGLWHHRRPAWYSEALSTNKRARNLDYDPFQERRGPDESGRFFCERHGVMHWAASRQGKVCKEYADAVTAR